MPSSARITLSLLGTIYSNTVVPIYRLETIVQTNKYQFNAHLTQCNRDLQSKKNHFHYLFFSF